jgi:hypothetical protein
MQSKSVITGKAYQKSATFGRLPIQGIQLNVFSVCLQPDTVPKFVKLNTKPATTDKDGFFTFGEIDASLAVPCGLTEEILEKIRLDLEDSNSDDANSTDDDFLDESEANVESDAFEKPVGDDDFLVLLVYSATAIIDAKESNSTEQSSVIASESLSVDVSEIQDERDLLLDYFLAGKGKRLILRRIVRRRRLNNPIYRNMIIPESNDSAAELTGNTIERASSNAIKSIQGNGFAFLGIGRAASDEIGKIGDERPEFRGKSGYLRSSDTWKTPRFSLLSEILDAPFAYSFEIYGAFGGELETADGLYYSITYSQYTGSIDEPFDPSKIVDTKPLRVNSYALYWEYFTPGKTDGKWKSESLGTLWGTVEGKRTLVCRRRLPRPVEVESWPTQTRLCDLYSQLLPNGLCVIGIEVYKKIGGTNEAPELSKVPLERTENSWMCLMIDNFAESLRFDKCYPDDPSSYQKLQVAPCKFLGVPETIGTPLDIDDCNEVVVSQGQLDGNEGILMQFSYFDLKNQQILKHARDYIITVEFTPRSTNQSADLIRIPLKERFAGLEPIKQEYKYIIGPDPVWKLERVKCVLIPKMLDGWPPEKGDPNSNPCSQYGVAIRIRARSRITNGWGYCGLECYTTRYIVLRKGSSGC